MSKGKMTSDHLAFKGKRKNGGQGLFPQLIENVEPGDGASVVVAAAALTPEKHGSKTKKVLGPHQSPMASPAAPPRHSESNQEACTNATPRTHRKLIMNESGEPGAAVAAASSTTFSAATPCKSATRSLRFGTSSNGGVLAAAGTSSFFSTHRPGLPPLVSSGGQSLQQHASVETHFELEEDPTFWEDHNVQVSIPTRPSSFAMQIKICSAASVSVCLSVEGLGFNAHVVFS
jgi:hypothetical protein